MPPHLAPAPTAPLGFADGQLEAAKWLALAAMFVDHVGRLLLGHPQDGWVFAVGRLAFPLFAGVLALNLARAGDRERRSGRTALRLLGWGLVAVAPSVWARGDPAMLNVLFTLGLGAATCWLVESHAPVAARVAGCLAVCAAAWFCEFGIAGVLLVPAAYLAVVRRDPGFAVVATLLAVATAALNGQFGGPPAFLATLASVPLLLLLRALPVALPRWQLLFYAIYPLHLAAVGALRASMA